MGEARDELAVEPVQRLALRGEGDRGVVVFGEKLARVTQDPEHASATLTAIDDIEHQRSGAMEARPDQWGERLLVGVTLETVLGDVVEQALARREQAFGIGEVLGVWWFATHPIEIEMRVDEAGRAAFRNQQREQVECAALGVAQLQRAALVVDADGETDMMRFMREEIGDLQGNGYEIVDRVAG